jgi:ribosome-associated translation inhibitor RaiA
MEIVYHAHHAEITEDLRLRAERGLRKLERRLGRATEAIVRFEGDGSTRRVEITIQAPQRRLIGCGAARTFGPALTRAVEGLLKQAGHVRGTRDAAMRRVAQMRRVAEA